MKIAYFQDDSVGIISYGESHEMRPIRVNVANDLAMAYGVFDTDRVTVYKPADVMDLLKEAFHSEPYVDFLTRTFERTFIFKEPYMQFIHGCLDCSIFPDLLRLFKASMGGSVGCARLINNGAAKLAMNWMGGMHHARRGQAKGFCYVNDIVMCILTLLERHSRVLYVDLDVHHGDGVEEAFFQTNRVCTLSFHLHENEFFPRTGLQSDVGEGKGKFYSYNVPFKAG